MIKEGKRASYRTNKYDKRRKERELTTEQTCMIKKGKRAS